MKDNTAIVIVISIFILGLLLSSITGIITDSQLAIDKERTHQLEVSLEIEKTHTK